MLEIMAPFQYQDCLPRSRISHFEDKKVVLILVVPGTNFSEILIQIQQFYYKKINLKMSPAKWQPFCPGLNVLLTLLNRKCQDYVYGK